LCQCSVSLPILTPQPNTPNGERKYIYLPDIVADWPWHRAVNPRYEEAEKESDAWFQSFKALTPQSQEAFKQSACG